MEPDCPHPVAAPKRRCSFTLVVAVFFPYISTVTEVEAPAFETYTCNLDSIPVGRGFEVAEDVVR